MTKLAGSLSPPDQLDDTHRLLADDDANVRRSWHCSRHNGRFQDIDVDDFARRLSVVINSHSDSIHRDLRFRAARPKLDRQNDSVTVPRPRAACKSWNR